MLEETKGKSQTVKVRFHTSKGKYKSGMVYELTEQEAKDFAPCCTVVKKKGGK